MLQSLELRKHRVSQRIYQKLLRLPQKLSPKKGLVHAFRGARNLLQLKISMKNLSPLSPPNHPLPRNLRKSHPLKNYPGLPYYPKNPLNPHLRNLKWSHHLNHCQRYLNTVLGNNFDDYILIALFHSIGLLLCLIIHHKSFITNYSVQMLLLHNTLIPTWAVMFGGVQCTMFCSDAFLWLDIIDSAIMTCKANCKCTSKL